MVSFLNKLDKNIMSLLENNIVRFVLLVGGTSYLIMIKSIPSNVLTMYNNLYIRIIIALVVAYLACFEPFYSVIIASLFILSLQELHNRRVNTENRVMLETSFRKRKAELEHVLGNNEVDKLNKNYFLEEEVLKDNSDVKIKNIKEDIELSIKKEELPIKKGKKLLIKDPAFGTLTNNVDASYITNNDLINAQSNLVCGSDPDAPVEVFPKILNAQGLTNPSGYNPNASKSSKFN
jgi:hypothetical protein